MTFDRIEIWHKDRFREIVINNSFLSIYGSEYCFTVLFAHRDYLNYTCSDTQYGLILKGEYNGKTFFAPPISKTPQDFISACGLIEDFCKNSGEKMIIFSISEQMKVLLQGDKYKFTDIRNNYEYLYNVSDMINLTGKKYHSKRNFINAFDNLYSYTIRKYQEADFGQIKNVIELWENNKTNYSEYEKKAIILTLENITELKTICDVIEIDGSIKGFILASVDLNNDVNILFEKADINYRGIYVALLNKFIKNNFSGCRYINMQEDMGIEGLRKSKLSYRPCMLLKKYNLTLND